MVVNVKLKNNTATVTRGKFARVSSVTATKTKSKTKALARVVAPASSEIKNGSEGIHHGGRIHAQRKFAQGANVGSPAATPVKSRNDEGRLRKRVISPTPPFPISKRPKTEDFLTFLCYRGTPVMPPDLDFFNYSALDKKDVKPVGLPNGNKGSNDNVASQSTNGPHHSSKKEKSPTPDKAKVAHDSKKEEKSKAAMKHVNGNTSKPKADSKSLAGKNDKVTASAVNKMNSLVKKDAKRNEKTTAARLNEQDARFAMTALKLKYQEKRLAQSKSTISKITKKVKERSVILTRSKAKSEKSPSKSPTLLKQKVLKKNASAEAKKVQSRNVPSPDIIYGVMHNKSKIAECSESENSSSSSSSSSSDSSSSSSDSEDEDEEPVVKSLRSGNKEFVVKPNRVKPTIRKTPTIRRMGTRAMQRTSKSPLRELPMYSLKKFKRKKIIKKIDPKGKNNKSKQSDKSKQETVKNKITEKQKGKADKSKEKDSVSKTKEKLKEKTKTNEINKTNNKSSISNKGSKANKLESKNTKKTPSRIENNAKKPAKKEETESESESESEETSSDDNKSSKSKLGKVPNQKTNSRSNLKSPKGTPVKKTSISKQDNSSKKKITRNNAESDEESAKKASSKVITKPKSDPKTTPTKTNQVNKKEIKSKSESSSSKTGKKNIEDKNINKKGNNLKPQKDVEKKTVKSKSEVTPKKKPTKNAPNKETDESSESEKSDSESESDDESDDTKVPAKPNKSPKKERESTLSDSFGRPMRKTREAAEIYMGLLNKDFSSDEDVMSDKNEDPNSDESGSTSSSETKFLEKQYNASLKRIEQQGKTTKVQTTKSTKSKNTSPKGKTTSTKKPLGRPPTKGKSPEKRILRSQRTHSEDIPQPSSLTKQRKSASPSIVSRRRISLPLASCDRRKEGAVRKSASICPRRPADFSYSSSGSDHDTSTSEDSSSNSDSDEKALAKNIEEIKRRSLEMKRKGKVMTKTKGRDTSDSEVDSSSDEESKPAKVIASLAKARPIAVKRRTSTTSIGEDSKNIATEMRRLVEQKRAVEAGTAIEEKPEQDTEMEMETEDAERSFSADDEQESTSESSRASSSQSSSSGSESDEETPTKPPVEKSSIAIQVDLDLEDIEAAAAASAATQTAARITEISATVTHMTHAETSTSTHTHTHTTQHSHIDLGLGYVPAPEIPLVPPPPPPPFIPSYPRPDFYQSLHLAPPMVSSIQMVGQGSQDFVSTHHLGIPVSMPLHPSLVPLAPRVMAPNPLCFSTTSITTAATLQTHIRSVAANLDIPLVRPIVGADSPLNVPLPLPRGPHCHMPSVNTPMTRPINYWSNDGRAHHYSAFRVPIPGKIIQQQSAPPPPPPPISCPNTMGSVLPLSIVQPQHPAVSGSSQMHHHQNFSLQHQQQRLPVNPRSVQHTAPNSLRPINCPSSSAQSQGFSILQNLPNVSIVPRFDRNSKTVVLPSQIASSSSKTKEFRKDKIKKEKPEGKKRKKIIMPQPPSPLLFNKNSANPATYVKKSSKSHSKEKELNADTKESKSDPFNKLLQMKKECISEGEQTVAIQKPSTSTPEKLHIIKRASSKDKSGDDLPQTNKKVEKPYTNSTGTVGHTESADFGTDVSTCSTKEMKMQDVPSFYPDEDDFQDPLKYIEQIRDKAEKYGMVKIVPPRSFRPECNVEDDMRFTAYNHYIHKMFKRWGPNVHETAAIKEHLRKTDVDMSSPPLLGGMEVDLSTLYHTVQSFGGLKEVIEKQKWHKVSDAMHFPKAANDRATKLDAIYVKYVLPFEMLSENERKKLMSSVDLQWAKRQEKLLEKDVDEESDPESDEDPMQEFDDCVVKGKSTPLSSYFRVARNTFSMLFQGKDSSCSEIESEYWKMVREGSRHLCVYSGSIDCAGVGWGFPLPKAGAKHPWNLKVLANSQGSALRSMGPVMGATVPTLHVAMVFTTYCWYRDPHSLPWIEYLHSGANKIWYSIPGKFEDEFRKALKELMPLQCKSKKLWLASDSAMVPPEMLLSKGVSVARAVQKPGEFLVVFPKTFTSAICTGYLVSESVCFAPPAWLSSCIKVFKDIRDSKEPPVFGLEKLLLSILTDNRASSEVLQMALPLVEAILKEEYGLRKKLVGMGLQTGTMGPNSDKVSKKKTKREEEHVHQCDVCNYILHLSIVTNKTREFDLCLPHAIQHFHKTKSHIKGSLLLFDHTDEDLENIVQGAKNRLEKRSS